MDLPPSELRHVQAADGWLDLDAPLEANDELEKIAFDFRTSPEVLAMRAKVYNQSGRFLDAAAIAGAAVRQRPDVESYWLALAAYQEREEIRGHETALVTLRRAVTLFPASVEIRFQASRMLAATGHGKDAEAMFTRALDLAQKEGQQPEQALKLRAFEDFFIGQLLWPEP